MKSYDSREGGSDFNATLVGPTDPFHSAIHEHNQQVAGEI